MEVSDEVVDGARAGDPEALTHVYQSLAPRVCGYLRSRGVEDPEGLTSEVFLGLIPRLGAFKGGGRELRTLVFSIAHARAVDDIRQRARRPVHTPYEPEHDMRTEPSAETALLQRSEVALAVLDRLSEDQRAVINLRVVADLTLEQTAEVLGKSTGAVKQLQRRALTSLRSLIRAEEVVW